MKLFHKPLQNRSLRMRITLFTGAVLVAASVVLTGFSMYHAQNQFMVVSYNYQGLSEVPDDIDITDGTEITISSTHITDAAVSEPMPDIAVSEPIPVDAGVASYNILSPDTIAIKAIRQFNLWSIVSMVVITLAGMLLVYFFAGKSLSPVHTLTQAVSDISEDTLQRRIPVPSAKDEIGSLTLAFNDMLSRLDEAFLMQKRFASNAAHELKTPIATIKTNLDILEFEPSPALSDYRQAFAAVKRTAERLSDVIDDLMTLADTGYPLHTERVSLQAMLKNIGKELSAAYNAKNIRIVYDFDDTETFVLCNETLAYRLFSNLIENAVKYNKENGQITLSVQKSKSAATVAISDTGVGIAPADIPHIWDAFYCADKSRARALGGAGLGLSIAKSIAERFDWELAVDSALSVGTTFTVTCKDAV